MPLWFNKRLDITEDEIRYTFATGRTIAEMAKLLGISKPTFYLYAKKFTDKETGLSLVDLAGLHAKKNNEKYKMEENKKKSRIIKYPMSGILSGKYPRYDRKKLQVRLITEGVFQEKCALCGFEERRVLDYKVPLLLVFKDGNKTNHSLENMEFCCYNCFFLNYNDLKLNVDNFTTQHLYRIS